MTDHDRDASRVIMFPPAPRDGSPVELVFKDGTSGVYAFKGEFAPGHPHEWQGQWVNKYGALFCPADWIVGWRPNRSAAEAHRAKLDDLACDCENLATVLRLWGAEVYPGTPEGMVQIIDRTDVSDEVRDLVRKLEAFERGLPYRPRDERL